MDDPGPALRHRTVGRNSASSYRDFARLRPTPYPLLSNPALTSPRTRTPSPKHRSIRLASRSVSPPKSRTTVPSPTHSDRFIPYSSSPVSLLHMLSSPPPNLHHEGSQSPTNPQLHAPGKSPEWPNSFDDTMHSYRLASALEIPISPKLLNFGTPPSSPQRSPPTSPHLGEGLFVAPFDPPDLLRKQARKRAVPPDPFRILDAPELHDDYYAQPLSWSVDGTIAVALGMAVYLWKETDQSVRSLSSDSVQDITSVAFNSTGDILAIAREDGSVLLQSPTERIPRIHIAPISQDAVGALSWRPSPNSNNSAEKQSVINEILVIGCFDGQVVLVDIVWYLEEFHAKVSRKGGWNDVHTDQICGIAWSNDGLSFATGANDNRVCLFEIPIGTLGMDNHWEKKREWFHQAAVKALAFKSGKGGILAAGGGVHDKKIRFYNTFHGTLVSSLDVDAQITTLIWSPTQSEILATFGYTAPGITTKCAVYAYPSLQCLFAFQIADEIRALYAVPSPSRREICLAGSDECIRFYRIWVGKEDTESREGSPVMDLVERDVVQSSGRANERVGSLRYGLSVIR